MSLFSRLSLLHPPCRHRVNVPTRRTTCELLIIYFPLSELTINRTGNKESLVKLVQRQIAKWPGPGKFQPSKVKVALIKSTLLDPTYGFTTNKPAVVFLHPPKGNGGTVRPVCTGTLPRSHQVFLRGDVPIICPETIAAENLPPSPPHDEENQAPLEVIKHSCVCE